MMTKFWGRLAKLNPFAQEWKYVLEKQLFFLLLFVAKLILSNFSSTLMWWYVPEFLRFYSSLSILFSLNFDLPNFYSIQIAEKRFWICHQSNRSLHCLRTLCTFELSKSHMYFMLKMGFSNLCNSGSVPWTILNFSGKSPAYYLLSKTNNK